MSERASERASGVSERVRERVRESKLLSAPLAVVQVR